VLHRFNVGGADIRIGSEIRPAIRIPVDQSLERCLKGEVRIRLETPASPITTE
jgi:hypothetical protein